VTVRWQLAQVNIAKLRAGIDEPELAGFVSELDRLNTIADRSPGFVWRMQDEGGNATRIPTPWASDIIANMSVWESIETLEAYIARPEHAALVGHRRQWFYPMGGRHLALWWVSVGHRPTLAEAADRLDLLGTNGPTMQAFTFRSTFPPPKSAPGRH